MQGREAAGLLHDQIFPVGGRQVQDQASRVALDACEDIDGG